MFFYVLVFKHIGFPDFVEGFGGFGRLREACRRLSSLNRYIAKTILLRLVMYLLCFTMFCYVFAMLRYVLLCFLFAFCTFLR